MLKNRGRGLRSRNLDIDKKIGKWEELMKQNFKIRIGRGLIKSLNSNKN